MPTVQRISIDQQIAEIGVRVTNAQLNITMPRVQMRLTNEVPTFEIERRNPSFRINRQQLNASMGLEPPSTFARSMSEVGRQGVMRGIRQAVSDGNFLGDVRRGGDRVGQLARNRAMSEIARRTSGRVNIGLMPNERPEVVWDMGEMSINWSRHSIIIDWDGEFFPEMIVDPKHSVEIFLRTEPYFRVSVEEMQVPGMTGVLVDQAI